MQISKTKLSNTELVPTKFHVRRFFRFICRSHVLFHDSGIQWTKIGDSLFSILTIEGCCTYQISNSSKEVTVTMRSGSILLCAALLVAPTASFFNGAIPRHSRSGKYLFRSHEDDFDITIVTELSTLACSPNYN